MKFIIKGISSLTLISLLLFGCNEQQKPAESQIINHNTLTPMK